MKKTVLALTAAALLVTGFAASAMADGRYYRDGSPAIYLDDGGGADGYLVQDRRYYDGGLPRGSLMTAATGLVRAT